MGNPGKPGDRGPLLWRRKEEATAARWVWGQWGDERGPSSGTLPLRRKLWYDDLVNQVHKVRIASATGGGRARSVSPTVTILHYDLPDDLHRRFKTLAAARGTTVKDLLFEVLELVVDRPEVLEGGTKDDRRKR